MLLSPSTLEFRKSDGRRRKPAAIVTLANLTGERVDNRKSFVHRSRTQPISSASSNCGGTIAVGATCTINITFTPSVTGAETATLSVSDSDASSPQTVPLTGTGTAPASPVFLTPAPVNFGNQAIGYDERGANRNAEEHQHWSRK